LAVDNEKIIGIPAFPNGGFNYYSKNDKELTGFATESNIDYKETV